MQLFKFAQIFYRLSHANDDLSKAAGFLFVCPEDRTIFLALRGPNGDNPNTWATVGGSLVKGESFIDGAMREVKEEMGSVPEIDKIIKHYDSKSTNFIYRTYLATISNKNNWHPKLDHENSDAKWFGINELPDNLHPGFRKSLKHLFD